MKENEFLDGVSNIEPDVVERFVSMDEKLQRKASRSKPKGILIRIGAVAACLALLFVSLILVPLMQDDEPSDNGPSPSGYPWHEVPLISGVQYSAKDISSIFPLIDSTVNYDKVYASDPRYLYINEITSDEYVYLYQKNPGKEADIDEFEAFVESYLPKISDAMNAEPPLYKIEMGSYPYSYFEVDKDVGNARIDISQRGDALSFFVFDFFNEKVTVDASLSDEEILSALRPVEKELFDIFNVSFSDAKVIKRQDTDKYAFRGIDVYFYNESDHALNNIREIPCSDYIRITLYRDRDSENGNIFRCENISYKKNRIDVYKVYTPIAKVKRLSLEDAEAMLYKDYVFGFTTCTKCMALQDKVSFEGYDFVGIEYFFGDMKGKTLGIPFYAFYKKIGTVSNGNTVYAKTYVPAIEISGCDEYFESIMAHHKN